MRRRSAAVHNKKYADMQTLAIKNLPTLIDQNLFDLNSLIPYLSQQILPYSPKAIRSSMGHILGLNLHFGQYEDIVKLKNNSYKTIIADLDGQNAFDYHSNNDKLILVIGNEGSGVSENARQLADTIITLPMENDVESLNASVSASILMYILTK